MSKPLSNYNGSIPGGTPAGFEGKGIYALPEGTASAYSYRIHLRKPDKTGPQSSKSDLWGLIFWERDFKKNRKI